MIVRPERVAIAAASAFAVLAVPQLAFAAGGSWGPDDIPYRNGVVCQAGSRTVALVSWPTSAGSRLGFATRSVTGPISGLPDAVAEPAVTPTNVAPVTDLPTAQSAALAYLFSHDGTSSDAATVGDVAALVANDAFARTCLNSHEGGLDAALAQGLAQQAADRAGPYTVSVSGPSKAELGSPAQVTALVKSAAGTPVPDMSVEFTGADASTTTATTGTDGRASTQLTVPSKSTVRSVTVKATVSAPTGVVRLQSPGAVPLLAAADPVEVSGQTDIPIDTSAHPVVHVSASPSLVLPGSSVHAEISVSGMNGHVGTASLDAVGPLAFVHDTGCTSYTKSDWDKADHKSSVAGDVAVVGDETVSVSVGAVRDAGCYLLVATVTTSNAIPAATAHSDERTTSVVAAAPVDVAVTADGHGVAVTGALHATVALSGKVPAELQDTSGTIVGPRDASGGKCPTSGWSDAQTAGSLSSSGSDDNGVKLESGALQEDGCYALRVQTKIALHGVGTISVDDLQATALVLDPRLEVTRLASASTDVGGTVKADVAVFGTLTQPGTLRLRLARLPDSSGGCFDRDYSSADVLPVPQNAPTTTTTGDNTYSVTSPEVPTVGCWTVEPELTLSANSSAQVVADQGPHTMSAFTVVQKQDERDLGTHTAEVTSSGRWAVAAGIVGVLLVGAIVVSVVFARRSAAEDQFD